MNFGTHKQHIIDSIELALTKEKADIVERFKVILGKCSSLFKSEDYAFWLQQLGSIPINEIPVTKHGLNEAARSMSFLENCDRHTLKDRVLHICEQLFTYSDPENLCPFKTEYHYYFHIPSNRVFKESEMGDSDLEAEITLPSDIRIAKIGEIEIDKSELI